MINKLLTLSKIKGIGIVFINSLKQEELEYLKKEQDYLDLIFSKDPKKEAKLDLDDVKIAIEISDKILGKHKTSNIEVVTKYDNRYPEKLKRLKNYTPPFLFYKGDISCLNSESIAIIGTRKISPTGISWGNRLSEVITKKGFIIISGLAKGSDTVAHVGCLRSRGITVAVLPSSLESIQPVSNRKLAEEILKNNGCLISEYPIGTKVIKSNFIARDRIQAGLSSGICILETGLTGGSYYAINTALSLNLPISCLSFDNEHYNKNLNAQGNKKLIEDGKCYPINSLETINWFLQKCLEHSNIADKNQNAIQQTLF